MKWQALECKDELTTQWNDLTILYNPNSGETHQLNLLAFDVLRFMRREATLEQTVDYICSLYNAQDRDNLFQQIEQMFKQFDDLGLIACCCE